MISFEQVSCSFSKGRWKENSFTAVSPLTIKFKKGSKYAIVGESGSGKTTIARMLAGVQRPTSGRILVEGQSIYEKRRVNKEHFKKVQIVQQNSFSALDPKVTIGASIEEPLHCFHKGNKVDRKERCFHLLELCNLPAQYYSRYPSELSGGEQKRVAIARAVAAEPDCIIFDEATNGFDLPLRKKIITEIISLQRQIGFTSIFITHDMEVALAVADEILVMKHSELVEQVTYTGDLSVFKKEYSKLLLEASELTGCSSYFE